MRGKLKRIRDNYVYFRGASVRLDGRAPQLRSIDVDVLVLDEYDKTIIDVVGHTDSTGSHQYNQALSERRADSVAKYLISQKVARVRIETFGMGETRPIADNATAQGRQLNRRVELTLIPVTK
jgi:outer membrane protein OmpA-like peptidoglycan-associated protein